MTPEIGRILVVIGLVVAGVGLLAVLGFRLPFGNLVRSADRRVGAPRLQSAD